MVFWLLSSFIREQAAKFFAEFWTRVLGLEEDESLDCDFNDLKEANPILIKSIISSCRLW